MAIALRMRHLRGSGQCAEYRHPGLETGRCATHATVVFSPRKGTVSLVQTEGGKVLHRISAPTKLRIGKSYRLKILYDHLGFHVLLNRRPILSAPDRFSTHLPGPSLFTGRIWTSRSSASGSRCRRLHRIDQSEPQSTRGPSGWFDRGLGVLGSWADDYGFVRSARGAGSQGAILPSAARTPWALLPARPGVEASGRTSLPILGAVGGEVAGHCFRPVFEGLGNRGSSPQPPTPLRPYCLQSVPEVRSGGSTVGRRVERMRKGRRRVTSR